MEKFIHLGINSGVQLIVLIIELDQSFAERDVLQLLSSCRLQIDFLHPLMNLRSYMFDIEFL